jgi:hypothetical protein
MMATEKLTIVSPLTIRLTESLQRDVLALAELRGMERSEYIRHLILQDKLEQHRVWAARNQLFIGSDTIATATAHDKALLE